MYILMEVVVIPPRVHPHTLVVARGTNQSAIVKSSRSAKSFVISLLRKRGTALRNTDLTTYASVPSQHMRTTGRDVTAIMNNRIMRGYPAVMLGGEK